MGSLPIYPGRDLIRGLGYSQKVSDDFFVATSTTATGAQIDVGLAQYPLHSYELTYNFIRDGVRRGPGVRAALEYRTMRGFFLQIGGMLGRFLYKDIDDYQVRQNSIGVGDGITTTFTLTRTFGANGYFGTEPVGMVNTDPSEPFNVYLGGSATPLPQPGNYTLNTANPAANTITFATAPLVGQAIAVDMGYFYYCKLGDNSSTLEKFMDRLWKLDKVTLQTCRPGA